MFTAFVVLTHPASSRLISTRWLYTWLYTGPAALVGLRSALVVGQLEARTKANGSFGW